MELEYKDWVRDKYSLNSRSETKSYISSQDYSLNSIFLYIRMYIATIQTKAMLQAVYREFPLDIFYLY